MEKKETNLTELKEKADKQLAEIKALSGECRDTMVEAILAILKEHGNHIVCTDYEDIMGDPFEIEFLSDDSTYHNAFCSVQVVRAIQLHDGTPSFDIDCDDAINLPEYALSYDNVWSVYTSLVAWDEEMKRQEQEQDEAQEQPALVETINDALNNNNALYNAVKSRVKALQGEVGYIDLQGYGANAFIRNSGCKGVIYMDNVLGVRVTDNGELEYIGSISDNVDFSRADFESAESGNDDCEWCDLLDEDIFLAQTIQSIAVALVNYESINKTTKK